ncbi:MAG TPA: hypothetical protein VMM84_19180 [Pyrinomonadaceae bacterium]|nr:hypothetical protein [Pyrinomonadaceae bacterium]
MQAARPDYVDRLKVLEEMISRLKRRAGQLEELDRKYWTARRVIFVAGIVLAFGSCSLSGWLAGWVLAGVFIALFLGVAFYHAKVRFSIAKNGLMMDIKRVQMARIHLEWDKIPSSDYSPPERKHAFETDLDVTGTRSLHRLVDTSITRGGSERLVSWLLGTKPNRAIIKKRQKLVDELKSHSLFRDKLQLYSEIAAGDSKGRWDSQVLSDWLTARVRRDALLSTLKLLGLLAVLNVILFVFATLGVIPHVWPVTFMIYVSLTLMRQSQIAMAWGELLDLEKALRKFRVIFQYLESRKYKNTPGLAEICAPFLDEQKRPSAELRRVGTMASALGVRTNPILWAILNAVVPWDFYFTYRLEYLKEEVAQLLPGWLDAWFELEALNSLANFYYLNPGYVFPEIASEERRFEARALGHPLIKPAAKVTNDFEMNDERRITILTGSNMAGKSTFLRTIGVNTCLAYAGAPVNASSLQLSLFRVFTCINVSDSVQDGLSYFYAEVKRLKALLAATEMQDDFPVLFLIDEIFRGTNNRERHLGARAFIRTLATRDTAIGVVATHDLELVELAVEIAGIENFHFREEVREGRMVFDYKLRPGPCPTTNALEIMRLEGLPV